MSLQAIRVFTAGVGLVQLGLYHSLDSLTEEHTSFWTDIKRISYDQTAVRLGDSYTSLLELHFLS